MTKQEIAELGGIIAAYFPNFKTPDKGVWINAWHLIFKDTPKEDVQKALLLFVAKNTAGFPPTPGQLIEYLPKPEEVTEQEVWKIVRKAISNGNYNSREEYENLPEPIQKAVGGPESIKAWASADTGELETVIQSQFLKSYRQVKNRIEISGGRIEIKQQHQIEKKEEE